MKESILTQEEIELLLKAIPKKIPKKEEIKEKNVLPYDFRRYAGIAREYLPLFKEVHEKFNSLLGKKLSAQTGETVIIKMGEEIIGSVGEYIASAPHPSFLCIFKLEPILGDIFINIEPASIHTLVDIAFGGTGIIVKNLLEITLIEKEIIYKSTQEILQCLSEAWSEFVAVSPIIIANSTHPVSIASIDSPTPVLILKFNILLEKEEHKIPRIIKLAYSAEAVGALASASKMEEKGKKFLGEHREKIKEILKTHKVELYVEIGKTFLPVRELLNLEIGDIILLDKYIDDELFLYVEGKEKWVGRPGQYREKYIFKITNPIKGGEINGKE